MSTSGQAMPVGDRDAHWAQVFAEDFTTDAPLGSFPGAGYSGKWGVYKDGWQDTTKRGTYYPSKVLSVANSCLQINLHHDAVLNKYLVATAYPILDLASPRAGMLWGRYSVRFKVDPGLAGYKTAWLLWPDSGNWPHDGEIDFPEGNLDDVIKGYVHHQDGTSPSDQDGFNSGIKYSDPAAPRWHTATQVWYPKQGVPTFEAYLDSTLVGTTSTRVPNTPMHYDLQSETCTWGELPDPAVAGSIYVDWLVAYAWRP